MKKFSFKAALCISLVLTIITTPVFADSPSQVSPLSTSTINFFGKNGIYYYTPGNGSNNSCLPGSNTDYGGGQVLPGAVASAVQANQSFYENAAKKYGFDWRILAAIHVMENNAKRENPANGQGAYQLYSYIQTHGKFLPAGPISDTEFQRQSDIAASVIAEKAQSVGANLNTTDGIKRTFFAYNGRAQRYYDKAIAMGYTDAQAKNGEGSPYVMNWFDAKRDPRSPEMDPHWPGMYTGDGVWNPTAKQGRAGAFTIYASLGGKSGGGSSQECYIVGPGGGRLPTGASGMTLEEAKAFMEQYKSAIRGVNNFDLQSRYGMTLNDCSGGIGYNCVSFTKYFINIYTDRSNNKITGSIGDGKDVVGKLTLLYPGSFQDGGNTPKAYAIFSTGFNKTYGHTGVILGINTNTRKIIIGEAACGSGESGIKAYEISLNEAMSTNYRYAYPRHPNI